MFAKVARTLMGRSRGADIQRTAEAACGIEPLEVIASGRSPRDAFFDVVDRVARDERLPAHLAMAKVRVERPSLFWAAFPQQRRRPARASAYGRTHARSQLFDAVSEIAGRERVPQHVAIDKARAELFAACA